MIVSISGEKPYATIFTDGKSEAVCDTTIDKGGGGSGFRPHDLLEAAFACCLNISLRMLADKHQIPLCEAKVSVSLNRDDPEQTVFEYAVELRGDLTAKQRRELVELAASCPVGRTISKKISFVRSSPAPAL
jgi:putative redox protein